MNNNKINNLFINNKNKMQLIYKKKYNKNIMKMK